MAPPVQEQGCNFVEAIATLWAQVGLLRGACARAAPFPWPAALCGGGGLSLTFTFLASGRGSWLTLRLGLGLRRVLS